MTSPVKAQITAGASDSAPLLLDLNDADPMYVLHNGFTLGQSDGDERRVEMTVRLRGENSVPTAITELMRAINRPDSHVLWQASRSHQPVWWRVLGSVSEMNFQETVLGDENRDPIWTVMVSLMVEPFGYAEKVTLPPITVSNASLGVTIPHEIRGDAPTLATFTIKPADGVSWGGWENLLAVTPVLPSCSLGAPVGVVASPLPAVITWEAESFTLAADAVASASSSYSGGSAVSLDEQDTSWRMVLAGIAPSSPPPGRYQVWVRVRRTANTGKMRFRLGTPGWVPRLDNSAPLYAPLSGAADLSWMHVGDASFPAGMAFEGLTENDVSSPSIQLQAKGSAAGSAGTRIFVDRFALVPIVLAQGGESTVTRARWLIGSGPFGLSGGFWNMWRIDGQYRRSGEVNFFNQWFVSNSPPLTLGSFPVLHPGMRNIVQVFQRVHNTVSAAGSDDVTKSCEVTISYYPRVRHMVGL